MSEQGNSEGLLSGYRVLDLTDQKGLLSGKILGDLGADVIKVEPPGGHPARNIGPFYKDIIHPDKSLFWFYTNVNKRSITLNLETEDGREIFRRLVKTADFVIESFGPGYMDKLGLGYSDLERINPRVIMTSITAFGQTGPYAHFKMTDLCGVAMGGMQRVYGDPDRAPVRHSQPQFYFLGSLHAALGSVMAHYHRQATGEGQYVDVSCQQAVVLALMMAAEYWDIVKVNYRRQGAFVRLARPTPPGPLIARYIYPCKDGHVQCYVRGGAQAGFVASSRAMVRMANREGRALELKDYDWAQLDVNAGDQKEVTRVENIMGEFFLTKTKAELFEEAVKESILLCPVTTTKDILESAQLAFRQYWTPVYHPELTSTGSVEPGDTISYPGAPVKVGIKPWRIWRRPPLIGEHNAELYEQELGLTKAELTALKSRGVI